MLPKYQPNEGKDERCVYSNQKCLQMDERVTPSTQQIYVAKHFHIVTNQKLASYEGNQKYMYDIECFPNISRRNSHNYTHQMCL